ncbi:hypothetical protein FBEOM_10327, partial [Fusarium beomiforme]
SDWKYHSILASHRRDVTIMAGEWDASAIAAVAALVIALFALLVAVAQALQQYLITGQLIGLCDNVVFGPFPGHGYRIWQFSQFRFRVLYSIPQINLETDLWPEESPHIKSYAIGQNYLPDIDPVQASEDVVGIRWIQKYEVGIAIMRLGAIKASVGEASWVSFCKAINGSCGASVRYYSVTYDADRCPSDLVTAPMQVSMRDIAVMGLTAGMKVTQCSFIEKSISMQGAIGSITSSNHAILGPILHFTPRVLISPIPRSVAPGIDDNRGIVDKRWLARTWDVCTVAGTYFHSLKRRTTRRLDDRWTSYQKSSRPTFWDETSSYQEDNHPAFWDERPKRAFQQGGIVPADVEPLHVEPPPVRSRKKTNTKTSNMAQTSMSINHLPQDGHWTITQVSPPTKSAPLKKMGGKEEVPVVRAQGEAAEDGERHDTPLNRTGSTVDPDLSGGQDPAAAEATREQYLGQKPTTKQAPESSGGNLVIDGAPDHAAQLCPDQANDSSQCGARETRQSDDIQTAPIRTPLSQDELKKGVSAFEMEQVQSESQCASLETRESKIPARNSRKWATVEDAPDSGEERESHSGNSLDSEPRDRSLAAKKRQQARNERSKEIQRDKAIVEVSKINDIRPQFLLAYPQDELGSGPSRPTAETEEDKARAREAERHQRREERELERDRRNKSRGNVVSLNRMDMYWFCQVDIYQGFWATPWMSDAPLETSLVGAITVILEALLGFLEEKVSLVYCDLNYFFTTESWISHGGTSYPAYASNARGGVIAQGSYKGVLVPAFQCTIPALELLYSYEWQVSSYLHDQERYCEQQNIELMRIDAWLSCVGRTENISRGPNELLKGAPALVQLLQAGFEVDFMNIDLSAKEGGY